MRILTLLALAALIMSAGAAQDIRIVGGAGVTLKDIAGTPTLVTVVLKGSGAEDSNLRVLEVLPSHFNVLTPNNKPIPYLYEDVEEIRIQGDAVEKEDFQLVKSHTLRDEDRGIVGRAWERAESIFDSASKNQGNKIRTATLLGLNPKPETAKKGRGYLMQLVEVNEIKTQLDVCLALYAMGDEVPANVLQAGLLHGSRKIRAKAAALCGLTRNDEATPQLNRMLQDRVEELSLPAAKALARLGKREFIPKFIEMLCDPSDAKGDAAVGALSCLGGEDVLEQMKLLVETTDGLVRYRIIRVLYQLGDPLGRKLMIETFNNVPTLKPEAALVLAKEDYWDATQYLLQRLMRREDPKPYNLLYRARNAASLATVDEPAALATFQELLRAGAAQDAEADIEIKATVCRLITEVGSRKLLSIVQPAIENEDERVALAACTTAVSLAVPEYRGRLMEMRE